MKLQAGCDMTLKCQQPSALVAMLRPRSGQAQWIHSEKYLLDPPVGAVEYVDGYGNLCQRILAPAGEMRLRVETVVETSDTASVEPEARSVPVQELPDDALQFLLPSRYCPSDKLGAVAREVSGRGIPGYGQVENIRRWIHDRFEYRYGVSDASTDAADSLQARQGVCRDFSHVGLSLCRAIGIPARMVVGYLYQLDPMDMHAWFEAFVGDRWYTFDATQAEPRGGRIVVAYGRDAADVALISEYGPIETTGMNVWVELAE